MTKPVTEDHSEDKIIRAYQVFGSTRKAAGVLGVSHQSVYRYLRKKGVKLHPVGGFAQKGTHKPEYHTGCLANWLRENPGRKLPKSPSAIAKITGCSVESVKSYLYRRRKRTRSRYESGRPDDQATIPGLP